MIATRIAAVVLLVMGVSLVVGHFQASRRHAYVLLVGLALLALAGALVVTVPVARLALLTLTVVCFLAGMGVAVRETQRTIQDIQRERQARQQAMEEYLEQLKRKYQEKVEREHPEQFQD